MKPSWKVLFGSSLCLASVPTLTLAATSNVSAVRRTAKPPNPPVADRGSDVFQRSWAQRPRSGARDRAATGQRSTVGWRSADNLAAGSRPTGAEIVDISARLSYRRGSSPKRPQAVRKPGRVDAPWATWYAASMTVLLSDDAPPVRISTTPSVKPQLRYVTAKSGDSLWSISQRYHVSLTALEQWNHLTVSSIILIGQHISLQPSAPGAPQVTDGRHLFNRHASVRAGDLLHLPAPGATTRAHAATLLKSQPPLSSRAETVTSPGLAAGIEGLAIVQYAREFLGVPYVWGGESTAGFDCSGLVQFVLAHFDIAVGRTTFQQFTSGRPVAEADLLPGDLLFFSTYTAGASHVGIYAGGGEFISAAGNRVQILSLGSPYWSQRLVGARRMTDGAD